MVFANRLLEKNLILYNNLKNGDKKAGYGPVRC